jgi:hypothetical protein
MSLFEYKPKGKASRYGDRRRVSSNAIGITFMALLAFYVFFVHA